jgi:geranylgeranyl pyrophosphate synthase
MTEKNSRLIFDKIRPFLQELENELNSIDADEKVPLFYDPIKYVMQLPGKRIRPVLVFLSAAVLGQSMEKSKYAAAAVELLHNFTLVHDDIMDMDNMRRGRQTVHTKWDTGTAILAGDGLMGLAFLKLLQTGQGDVQRMARRFTETMLVICEGQGLDKMFENSSSVTVEGYLDMIARKTAVLLELSCELGALTAGADEEQIEMLRRFGYELGMGFQIQDDWLDILGDEKSLGKKVGSDLERQKQTILTLRLKERRPDIEIFSLSLDEYRAVLNESGLAAEIEDEFNTHFKTAYQQLDLLPQNEAGLMLRELTDFISRRTW